MKIDSIATRLLFYYNKILQYDVLSYIFPKETSENLNNFMIRNSIFAKIYLTTFTTKSGFERDAPVQLSITIVTFVSLLAVNIYIF